MRLPRHYRDELVPRGGFRNGDYIVGSWTPSYPFTGWILPRRWWWLRHVLRAVGRETA